MVGEEELKVVDLARLCERSFFFFFFLLSSLGLSFGFGFLIFLVFWKFLSP